MCVCKSQRYLVWHHSYVYIWQILASKEDKILKNTKSAMNYDHLINILITGFD